MNYLPIILILLALPLQAMERNILINIKRETTSYFAEPIAVVDNVEEIPNFKIDTRINSPEYGPRLGLKTHKEKIKKRASGTIIYPKKRYVGSPLDVIDAADSNENSTITPPKTLHKTIKKNERSTNKSIKKKKQTRKQINRRVTSAARLHEKFKNFLETLPDHGIVENSDIILKFLSAHKKRMKALAMKDIESILHIKNRVGLTLYDYTLLFKESGAEKFLSDLQPNSQNAVS